VKKGLTVFFKEDPIRKARDRSRRQRRDELIEVLLFCSTNSGFTVYRWRVILTWWSS
jgi:hypothetical protein